MAALVSDDRIPNEVNTRQEALDIANRILEEKYGPREGYPSLIATREGSSNVVSVLSAIYGGKEIKYAFREGKDPSFIVDGDSYQTARVTVIPEYKASYMETSREKFLQETQDSEKN